MSLVVNNNLMAANVARNLNIHYGNLSTSTERLSSGLRINSAADDAAGLAIRELQRADITTLYQGARNANDAVSLIQTADGALQTIDEQLIRMKELAEQAATGTYNSTQRLMIESEYQQLASEITRISNTTDFNGIKLLDGTLSGDYDGNSLKSVGELKVHFGTSNDSAEDFYHINIGDTRSAALGLGNELVVQSELETNPTNAGYEELRDRSVKQIYDTTYEEQYTKHYNEIYGNLVSTANPALPPIPMEEAAAQAAEQADLLATKEATADAEMTKATLDQVYDHTYLSVFAADPRVQGIADELAEQKRTPAYVPAPTDEEKASAAVAAQDALKIATDTMYSLTQKIAEDGNLTSLDAMLPLSKVTLTGTDSANAVQTIDLMDKVTAFPVKTTSSASAYIEQTGKEAYSAIYNELYYGDLTASPPTGLYAQAIAEAEVANGGSLTTEQIVTIQDIVHKTVHEKAIDWSESLQAGMQNVYNNVYHSEYVATITPAGYQDLYNTNLTTNGMPPDIAQIRAEYVIANGDTGTTPAIIGAWDAMEKAATDAIAGTAYYGVDPVTKAAKPLQPGSLTTNITIEIPSSANIPIIFTASAGARVGGANGIYTAIDDGTTLLMSAASNQRGLNGSAQGLIETAEYFADAFDGFSPAGSTISTQEAAGDALDAINEAIISKDKIRAHLGAIQNRLEETINNLNIQAENLQASESRISDVDVAIEMTEFVRNQILTQSAVAMLSQANSLPQMAQQIISGG